VGVQPEGRSAGARAYVLCAEPRSGSNLLCEALRATGAGGRPDEYLDATYLHRHLMARGLRTLAEHPTALTRAQWLTYLQTLLRDTATGGVFGVKAHRHQYEMARRRGLPDLWDTLASSCTDVRAVLLTRQDTVRQAVSTFIAAQTGRYLSRPGTAPAERTALPVAYWRGPDAPGPELVDGPPAYDFEEIRLIVDRIRADERTWRAEVEARAIPHLAVTYEALTARRAATIAEVCRFLDLPEPRPFEPGFRKQSDRLNEAFIARYRRMAADRSG
jgi:LPS sulfotransferase NodH